MDPITLWNEEADKMAKMGAGDDQQDNPVTFQKMKTILKSLHKPLQPQDSYHQLSRQEQVVIFCLQIGHNRLNHHMNRRFRLVSSPMCHCGVAKQTTEHILQDCGNPRGLREEIWPVPTCLQDKLYGPVGALRKTTDFIYRSRLQV